MNQLLLDSKLNAYSKEELLEIFGQVATRQEIVRYLLDVNKSQDYLQIEKLEKVIREKTPKPKKDIDRSLYKQCCASCGDKFNWDSSYYTKSNRKYKYCIKCQVQLKLQEVPH